MRRRNLSRSARARPISMIETSASKSTLQSGPTKVDSRRRTMYFGQPRQSTATPVVSATQRRLAYSQSLRERRNPGRKSQSFQGDSSTSSSLSFRYETPLIYTAFRNTKYTASRAVDFIG